MTQHFATHSARLQVNADEVRTEELNGREHVVAPVTLVREMVLKGELLPFEEIQRTAMAWNGSPVTVTHPRDDDGGFLPASMNAAEFERHAVGHVFGAEADPGRRALDGDVWMDAERAAATAEALDRDDPAGMLLDGESVEVSTGYWYRKDEQTGTYEGAEYSAQQRDVQPDHLASLPNGEGECAISDGCGAGAGTDAAAAAASSAFESSGHETAVAQGAPIEPDAEPSLLTRIANAVGIDTGDDELAMACHCSGDCECESAVGATGDQDGQSSSSTRMVLATEHDDGSTTMTTFDMDELATQSGLSVETLESLDDDELEALAERTLQDDEEEEGDGDEANTDPDDGGDGDSAGGDDTETANALMEKLEDIEQRLEAQEEAGASRADLVATIQTHAEDVPEEDLEEMSTSALKAMADSVAPSGGVYAGRAGAAGNSDDIPESTGVSIDALGGDD